MMSSSVARIPSDTPNRNAISYMNLIMRNTSTQITVVQMGEIDPDPELFIVTSVKWREKERGLYSQLPRILSYLEVMRGTRGVPDKVYLDSMDGIRLYIPSGKLASEIPREPTPAIGFLRELSNNIIDFTEDTAREVLEAFWRIAKKRGFNEDIVDALEKKELGHGSSNSLERYAEIMQKFFSLSFRLCKAESTLHLEERT